MPRNPRRRLGDRALAVVAVAGIAALASAAPALAAVPAAGETQLVSVNTGGTSSGSWTSNGRVSGNGRYVVFASTAQDLVTVPASTGGQYDVFRRDLLTGTTVLVSFDSTGLQAASGGSGGAAVSADGRYVVFDSSATDIDPLDTTPDNDIYLRDMDLGITTLVSVNAAGSAAGNDYSGEAAISGDGSIVTFTSEASDLVATDTNGVSDVFFRTVSAIVPVTALVSLRVLGDQTSSPSGLSAAALSFDGRYVAYDSLDTSIFPMGTIGSEIYRRDLTTGETRGISYTLSGSSAVDSYSPSISSDGSLVAFSSTSPFMYLNDTNGVEDVFVRSLVDNSLTVVSVPRTAGGGAAGASTSPSISGDGLFVAFESEGTDLVDDTVSGNGDIYVRSLADGTTSLVSRNFAGTGGGSNNSYGVTLSGDGSVAAFASNADDLTSNDPGSPTDMFVVGLDIPVVAATPPGPALARTGSDPTLGLALAAALLAAGALVLLRRRAA